MYIHFIHTFICVCVCVCVCVFVYTFYTYVYTFLYICIYFFMLVYPLLYIYVYTIFYICINSYMYIYIYKDKLNITDCFFYDLQVKTLTYFSSYFQVEVGKKKPSLAPALSTISLVFFGVVINCLLFGNLWILYWFGVAFFSFNRLKMRCCLFILLGWVVSCWICLLWLYFWLMLFYL